MRQIMEIFTKQSPTVVKIIISDKTWLESDAIAQLENTARLEGMERAVGLPDLHPGKGHPIGAAFLTKGWIYPQLVGSDIGCGMGFWQTDLKTNKIKLDKWAEKLDKLDAPWDGECKAWLEARNIDSTDFDVSLGTIGGGNHFAELQKAETVYDQTVWETLRLDKQSLFLLVHSGSRGLGENILRMHTDQYHDQGFPDATEVAAAYIKKHDHAVQWAQANRALIAHRFMSCLRTEGNAVLDINHNTVTPQSINGCSCWLHRKGAAPADKGVVVIPGSRGDFSYLARPTGNQEDNAFSLAHGAGRKWKRSDVRGRLGKYRKEDFQKTALGSMVICEDKDLIFEEAPQAYKNIESVIGDLVAAGLVELVAKLRPVLTYKTRRRK
ncbi:MAG: RNA ligase RtcB family protein [Alphaproteobacteria bacterium]|nr:RNA ligase RtcB family protein [Alphaproteobacteria bacterium]